MNRGRWSLVVLASSWVAACAESAGPSHAVVSGQQALSASGVSITIVSGPSPEAHEVSFWAYQDRDASALVRYQAADGTWQPYVEVVVPQGALFQRPDGSLFAPGDSILVTMTVDSVEIRVDLEPTGLVFSALTPARLTMWYTGADPDFDGDGDVDDLDAYIQESLLGLWLQVTAADPWEAILATHSLSDRRFTAILQHFSGYAVAW